MLVGHKHPNMPFWDIVYSGIKPKIPRSKINMSNGGMTLAGAHLFPGAVNLRLKTKLIPILVGRGDLEPQRITNYRAYIGLLSNYGGVVLFRVVERIFRIDQPNTIVIGAAEKESQSEKKDDPYRNICSHLLSQMQNLIPA